MPYRLYNDEKIKAIILYLLNELDDPYEFQTISEIIVWDGSINYFVFTECFNQLVECQGIVKSIDPESGKELFQLSDFGKEMLEAVEETLLKFVKERIMRSATRLLAFKKDGSTVSTQIERQHDGYDLTCTIKNKKFDLLKLKMYFDNKEEAELVQMEFDHRAEHIYSGILALLTGDTEYIL